MSLVCQTYTITKCGTYNMRQTKVVHVGVSDHIRHKPDSFQLLGQAEPVVVFSNCETQGTIHLHVLWRK